MYQLLFPAADTTGRQERGHGVIDRLLDRVKRGMRFIRTTKHIHRIMIQRVMYMAIQQFYQMLTFYFNIDL